MRHLHPAFAALLLLLSPRAQAAQTVEADICVYGATSGGVIAAVQAARMGKRVVLLEFGRHLGGMTSGGLGATDVGNKSAIGGLAREFYHRVALHYAKDESWPLENRDEFFANRSGRSTLAEFNSPDSVIWTFEPHVAENIFRDLLQENKVPVHFNQRLANVTKTGRRIIEMTMENGAVFRAKMFIDATYEGDLMAKAKVSYRVGREANATYHETINGVRAETLKHQFKVAVDPYVKPGDPHSGLLPFIQTDHGGKPGDADNSIQAYNFRLCYTKNPTNRLPHIAPDGYAPAQYELLARYLEALTAAGQKPTLRDFCNPVWLPNGKTDINNNGGFSTDFIGANHEYPEASYATREKIWKAHTDYTRGLLYFLATNPRVPENLRRELQEWGPAKDEFADTGNWTHQLYVRQGRRMISDYVMTEHDCRGTVMIEDSVGLGSYGMDTHNARRIVTNGQALNEGDVQVAGFRPYPISYRSIVPKAAECENLLVPVCVSATHASYGSIRMEPVFMVLGQSAGAAASLALDAKIALQKVSYPELRSRLLADKQVLAWENTLNDRGNGKRPSLRGILVDDADAAKTGNWNISANNTAAVVGSEYMHDGNAEKGAASIAFTPDIPKDGRYEIILRFPPHQNRASNVPVEVVIAGRKTSLKINQRDPKTKGVVSVGKFNLPKGKAATVTLFNRDTDGYVVADGVQFLPVK